MTGNSISNRLPYSELLEENAELRRQLRFQHDVALHMVDVMDKYQCQRDMWKERYMGENSVIIEAATND